MRLLSLTSLLLAIAATFALTTPVAANDSADRSTVDPEARAIIQRMKRAQGGEPNLDRIVSIRLEGTILTNDEVYEFVQIKKRPNYQRLTLTRHGAEVVFGYDGEEVWRRTRRTPIDQPKILDPGELPEFVRDSSFADHLFRNDTRIEFLGRTNELGYPCYRLRSTLPNGEQLEHLVDASSDVVVRLKTLNMPPEQTVVTIFSDYRRIEQLQIPFQFSTFRNGEIESEVTVSKVDLNIGVYDAFFQIPGKVYITEEDKQEKQQKSSSPTPAN